MRIKLVVMALALLLIGRSAWAADNDGVFSFSEYRTKIEPFFKAYCVRCHGLKKVEGDMRLDRLSPVVGDEHAAETWQEVLDVLNIGEMPPKKEKQPATAELAIVIETLTNGLFEVRQRLVSKREITLRRMNRREYEHTVAQLLGVSINAEDFPVDGTVNGFDTAGEAQFMSEIQFEKYLKWGRVALDRALTIGPRPESKLIHLEGEDKGKMVKNLLENVDKAVRGFTKRLEDPTLTEQDRKKLNKNKNNALKRKRVCENYMAQPSIRVGYPLAFTRQPFAGRSYDNFGHKTIVPPEVEGEVPKPRLGRPMGRYKGRVALSLTCKPKDGKTYFVEIMRRDSHATKKTFEQSLGFFQVTGTLASPQVIEVDFENTGEMTDIFFVRMVAPPGSGMSAKELPDSTKTPFILVDWMEIEGPIFKQWPPKAWQETFFKGLPKTEQQESAYAREIISRFAYRAFRHRPAESEYLDKLHGIYLEHRADGADFVTAIKEALAIVLASPYFVYLVEAVPSPDSREKPLDDLELATRLSYFLWSQGPDDALYALAKQGGLRKGDALRRQVERMLDDPKSQRFREAFVSQWLGLEWLDMIVINRDRFPEFSEGLRRAFREETIRFYGYLIDQNLSAANFIDSDFVVVNGVLADYYGLKKPAKTGFQRVDLPPDSPRGGLLGQGAILTMGGTGERTSPVERGVFVYTHLLGREVPPPPPNVPQLKIPEDKPLTIRETLTAHIAKAQCASCHQRMDPLGFALEHFDPIGRWRDQEVFFHDDAGSKKRNVLEIDATGVMPDGKRKFQGHEQLKAYLLDDTDQMADGLIKASLTYALGRRVGFADGELVTRLQTEWKNAGYGMRDLIHAIVQAREFQTK